MNRNSNSRTISYRAYESVEFCLGHRCLAVFWGGRLVFIVFNPLKKKGEGRIRLLQYVDNKKRSAVEVGRGRESKNNKGLENVAGYVQWVAHF